MDKEIDVEARRAELPKQKQHFNFTFCCTPELYLLLVDEATLKKTSRNKLVSAILIKYFTENK